MATFDPRALTLTTLARQSGREHDDLPARLETLGLHGYHPVTGTWVLRVVRTRTFPPCGRGGSSAITGRRWVGVKNGLLLAIYQNSRPSG